MKYFFTGLVFLMINVVQAQKGLVYYGQITSPGMEGAYGPDLNAYLVFNENESYYVTAKDSLETLTMNKPSKLTGNREKKVVYNGQKTFRYGEQVYYNRKKDSLWWSQRFGGNIYIAEKRPVIDWKLQRETKKIGSFTTHKATGEFRGRTYTAWYTTKIPLPYGPWKLQGLPGLILEAYDEKKEMYLYFKSLEYPTDSKTAITQVKRPKWDDKGWQSLQDFEDMLRESLVKAYHKSILMAEKYADMGFQKPTQKREMSEVYIESFE